MNEETEDENKIDENETKGEVPTQCSTRSQEEHDLLVKEALLGQLYALKQLNVLVA